MAPVTVELAGKGGRYFKVAVTTFSALQLLYCTLESWGCQQSNTSNIHWNKTKKQKNNNNNIGHT